MKLPGKLLIIWIMLRKSLKNIGPVLKVEYLVMLWTRRLLVVLFCILSMHFLKCGGVVSVYLQCYKLTYVIGFITVVLKLLVVVSNARQVLYNTTLVTLLGITFVQACVQLLALHKRLLVLEQ